MHRHDDDRPRTSPYGNDRSGYRSNDNARYDGGYQAGASSGEGASYGGRDWYGGGAGDNRPYADRYERGERGYSDYSERRYGQNYDDQRASWRDEPRLYDDRGRDAVFNRRGFGGGNYGGNYYRDNDRGYASNAGPRDYDNRYAARDRGYRADYIRNDRAGYGGYDRGPRDDRSYDRGPWPERDRGHFDPRPSTNDRYRDDEVRDFWRRGPGRR